MSWYVLYKEPAGNVLERMADRESALSTAFALAYGGHGLIELGRIGGGMPEAFVHSPLSDLLAEYAAAR